MDLRFQPHGVKELSSRFRSAPKIVSEELTKGITRLVLMGERGSKKKAPKWRGQLARSITHSVTPATGAVTGQWGTNLLYAKWKENGTNKKNYFVPWKYIGEWALAHGFDAPKDPDKAGIRVTGNATPFIGPAYREIEPKVRPEIQAAVKRAIARLRSA